MQSQTVSFAIQKNNGVVQMIGKSAIYVPKTNFKGTDGIKWYEDKRKDGANHDR